MIRFFTYFACVMLTMSFFSGCAGDDEPAAPQLRAVNGDPWVYVKQTNNNGETGSLPRQLFENNPTDSWDVYYYGFREQKLQGYEQAKQHYLDGARRLPGVVEQQGTQQGGITLTASSTGILFRLIPNESGGLVVESGRDILFNGETQKVVHYSHTPDLNTFSILFYMTSPQGLKALVAIAATKLPAKPQPRENEDSFYEYVSESKYLVSWDQSKTVQFDKCFIPYKGLDQIVDASYAAWLDALKERLNTRIVSKDSCPPFSDLNTHTIQYLDDWVSVNGPGGVMGAVWNRFFLTTGSIVDADMFIYKQEIADYIAASRPGTSLTDPDTYLIEGVQRYFGWVITHEFGHMLGLDHKMKGPKSVMSYDSNDFQGSIFNYDHRAIANLYPKVTRRTSKLGAVISTE